MRPDPEGRTLTTTDAADARPWLYGIAANLLRRHRRWKERRLRAYARGRGPGERDVLLLHAWADLTYDQIAEALAIPVGTVRSRLHRARGIVGELLREAPTPPALRAALYRVAARIPGVELVGAVRDEQGRRGIAVALPEETERNELVFDPRSAALLGERSVTTREQRFPGATNASTPRTSAPGSSTRRRRDRSAAPRPKP